MENKERNGYIVSRGERTGCIVSRGERTGSIVSRERELAAWSVEESWLHGQ